MFQNIYQNESDIITVLQRGGMFLHNGDTQLPDYMTLCPAVHNTNLTSMKTTNLSLTTQSIFMSKNYSNHLCTDDLHLHLNLCYSLSNKVGTI
jgi:hypothetical protein